MVTWPYILAQDRGYAWIAYSHNIRSTHLATWWSTHYSSIPTNKINRIFDKGIFTWYFSLPIYDYKKKSPVWANTRVAAIPHERQIHWFRVQRQTSRISSTYLTRVWEKKEKKKYNSKSTTTYFVLSVRAYLYQPQERNTTSTLTGYDAVTGRRF